MSAKCQADSFTAATSYFRSPRREAKRFGGVEGSGTLSKA
jgi:hypothetical protein